MGGYSSQRKSAYGAKEVYGTLNLPTSWANSAPDDIGQYQLNIIPEFFFGFYTSGGVGVDVGVRMATGGKWRAFWHAMSNVFSSADDNDKYTNPSWTLNTGQQLYMKSWVSLVNGVYKLNLNVSKSSYTGTDLMTSPFSASLNSSWGASAYNGNCYVNREIAIASNPTSYETSGCYLINGKWNQCGFVDGAGNTYVWTDANSYNIPSNSQEIFITVGSKRILRLRKDGAQVNSARIKATRTDASNGATETVSIDYRNPPQI